MKQFAGTIIIFFIALFAYTRLAGPIPFTITSVSTTKTDTFSVTGEGKVSVSPDIAIVSAGVQTQGATVKIAQNDLNTLINAVSSAVKKAGVKDEDIQTANYNINPMYDYNADTPRLNGFQASSNLTIKVRAIDTANSVIDAATQAGANQLEGISFDVDDKTTAQNKAREKAVDQAKTKAANAAKIAGFTLGKIINYSENFGNGPRPVLMYAKADIANPQEAPTQIETGSNEITVTVTLSYQIQ